MGDLASLDDLSLSMVLSRLDNGSLACLQMTCRWLRDFVHRRDAYIWLLKLREEFDFASCDDDRELDYMGLYRHLARQTVPRIVRFVGIYTNGSVDPVNEMAEDGRGSALTTYWADNAFREDLSPFCSVKGNNVDLVGVLLNGHRTKLKRERAERRYMQHRTSVGQFWMRRLAEVGQRWGEMPDDFGSDQQLRLFFLMLLQSFERGQGMGPMLFMEEAEAGGHVVNQLYLEARRMRERLLMADRHLAEAITPDPENADIIYDTSLIDGIIDGSREYRRCVAERFIISRAGELTCPVKAGFVFGAQLGHDTRLTRSGSKCSREEWLREMQRSLGTLQAYNDVLGLDMMMERCRQGLMPGIEAATLYAVDETVGDHDEILQRGSAFIEFERGERCGTSQHENGARDDNLKSCGWSPIGMFVFDTSWSLELPRTNRDTRIVTFPTDVVPLKRLHVSYGLPDQDVRDQGNEEECLSRITVDLKKRRMIDAVAIKLIVQENRMDEMNDLHESPNIDLAHFVVRGRQLDADPIATHRYFTRAARAANDASCSSSDS